MKVFKNRAEQNKFLRTFSIAFVCCLVLAVGLFVGAHKVAGINPFDTNGDLEVLENNEEMLAVLVDSDSMFYEPFTNSDRCNVLLLGVNQGLSDTIMFVSFDRTAQHVDIVSIPRDTYFYRDGFYANSGNLKINALYRSEGAVAMAAAVSQILMGVPINYYAIIDYKGVENIVDAIGGVPVNVKIKGGMHYKDPYDTPPLVIDIPEGEQVLDGEHAVQFLRYRRGYAMGDLGRVEAQQEFMKSAFKQVLKSDIVKTAKVVFENVDSDITIGAATSLATKAIGISSESINTYTLPVTVSEVSPFFVYANTEEIAEMMTEIYSIGTPEEEEPVDGEAGAEGETSEGEAEAE